MQEPNQHRHMPQTPCERLQITFTRLGYRIGGYYPDDRACWWDSGAPSGVQCASDPVDRKDLRRQSTRGTEWPLIWTLLWFFYGLLEIGCAPACRHRKWSDG